MSAFTFFILVYLKILHVTSTELKRSHHDRTFFERSYFGNQRFLSLNSKLNNKLVRNRNLKHYNFMAFQRILIESIFREGHISMRERLLI